MPRPKETPSSGFVYILRFSQNFVKIGHTQRDPSTRASEWDLPLLAYASAETALRPSRMFTWRWLNIGGVTTSYLRLVILTPFKLSGDSSARLLKLKLDNGVVLSLRHKIIL